MSIRLFIEKQQIIKIIIHIICFFTYKILYTQSAWPGEIWQMSKNLTDISSEFQNNLSGAHWNPISRRLWLCVNGPGFFCALKEDGNGSFMLDSAGGKLAKWNYNGDFEGICQADYKDKSVFIIEESSGRILEFDISSGGQIKVLHSWKISSDIPLYTNGSGPEGIVFVPDFWLTYNGFTDNRGIPYLSQNGMGGIILIAHQNGGGIYAFDLNRKDDTYKYIGNYSTRRNESSELAFDRSTGKLYIWHNTGSNYVEITEMRSMQDGVQRKFLSQKEYYGPKTGNLEGMAITPAETKENWFFATDDSNQNGYGLMWFKKFKPCLAEPFFYADKMEICTGDTIIFSDSTKGDCGLETYKWDFGEGSKPSTLAGKGPHKVVYDSEGNKSIRLKIAGNIEDTLMKANYIKVHPLPVKPIITQKGDTLYSSSETGNQWYLDEALLKGDTGRELIANKSGIYRVKVRSLFGCSSSSDNYQVNISKVNDIQFKYIKDVIYYKTDNGSLKFRLTSSEKSIILIEISDMSGKLLYRKSKVKLEEGENTVNLPFTLTNPGIYLFALKSMKFISTKKIVLIK